MLICDDCDVSDRYRVNFKLKILINILVSTVIYLKSLEFMSCR